jgi:hypothetical protein
VVSRAEFINWFKRGTRRVHAIYHAQNLFHFSRKGW